ncbi:type I pullulanase [Proteiniclasticum sp. C24MP]|uniref:type I pullulanase n=1 Tax=Proteiniclasticum sp. C24MP TaxID=3374101 RepID=UPI003754ECFD
MRKSSLFHKISAVLLLVFFFTPMLSVRDMVTVHAENEVEIIVHYAREDGNYEDWNLWLWEEGGQGEQVDFASEDDFGKVAVLSTSSDKSRFGFIVRKGNWVEKDIDGDRFFEVEEGKAEIWLKSGDETVYTEAPAVTTEKPEVLEGDLELRIHYRRFDENYDGWNLWIWPKGGEGEAYDFTSEDDFGKLAVLGLDVEDASEIGFIIRKGEWEAKDVDMDRFISVSKAEDGVLDVYLLEKDPSVYYAAEEVDLSPKILKAELTTVNKVKVNVSIPMELVHDQKEGLKVTSGEEELEIQTIYFSEGGRPESSSQFEVLLKEPLELGRTYTISKEGYGEKAVMMSGVFSTKAFENAYHFDGELGAIHETEKTTFRVWAPTATSVKLNLFTAGNDVDAYETVKMVSLEKGVWEYVLSGDNHGVYYTYTATNLGMEQEAVDPYAKAVGVNGRRAMVVDLDRTDPEGWEEDEKPELKDFTDAILYELHVRDLSISEDSGIEHKGKFLGLTEEGTTGPDGVSTGLSHLMDLGVTHLHLLPAFDFRSIDETKLEENNFNWGYDPQHFNVPEGSYSTDPYNGEVRIREFKEMVKTLHEKDIRVVMDVVYNHTGASGDSDFTKMVPGYYYRMNEDGSFSNGSGTGNETASERSMMRKYIVDSVVYWAREYGVDGFRFDLMALHDIDTMKAVRAALDEVDPTILIYGEGWTGGDSPLPDKEKALKRNTWRMDGVAAFSDDIRDGLKGHVFTDEDRGFINGAEGMEESIKFGIVASIDHPDVNYQEVKYSQSFWAKEPSQTITYVEAHDNLTLWDKLMISNSDAEEEELIRMHRMANAVVLTSQGIPFLHAGSDFLRTKDGNHNSYNAPDEINKLVWERKSSYLDNVTYFEGLIDMRKAHPAFKMDTAREVRENLSFLEMPEKNMVGYRIDGEAAGDDWKEILVLMNANRDEMSFDLEGNWNVMVNGATAGNESIETVSEEVKIPGQTLLVLVETAEKTDESPETPGEEKEDSGNQGMIIAALLAVGGAGGYGLYRKNQKKKVS